MNATGGAGGTFLTQSGLENFNGVRIQLQDNGPTQSTLLLQRKHKAMEIQQELDRKKSDIDERMARCAQREAELAARREKQKERMVTFQKYIQENEVKRQRALKREKEEASVRKQNEAELEFLQAEKRQVEQQREKLQTAAAALHIYDDFLLSVCQSVPNVYAEVPDVMKRYETLLSANTDLRGMVDSALREIDDLRIAQRDLDTALQDTLLVATSTAAARQTRLDEVTSEVARLDSTSHQAVAQQVEKIATYGQVKGSIANLLRRLDPEHHQIDPRHAGDMGRVLALIRTRVGDLRDIARMKGQERDPRQPGTAGHASRGDGGVSTAAGGVGGGTL